MDSDMQADPLARWQGWAEAAGDPKQLARMARWGQGRAKERLEALFDPGTFRHHQALLAPVGADALGPDTAWGDGVAMGQGQVGGRPAFAYAHDLAVMEGTTGERAARALVALYDQALAVGAPVVAIFHGNGARVSEGYGMLEANAALFQRVVRASGVIPQLAAVVGVAGGVPAYLAALMDLVVQVEGQGFAYVTSPAVLRVALGERVGLPELGGAAVHASVSGLTHLVAPTEAALWPLLRELLERLPANHQQASPLAPARPPLRPSLAGLVPEDPHQPFDVGPVIEGLVDEGSFLELHATYGPSVRVGLARWGGRSVALVANQPLHLAGALDVPASRKLARFLRWADAFDLPLVFLVDVPGFLPGREQEHLGILAAGAHVLAAMDTACPRISVILRRCYGGAYVLLNGRASGGDLVLAWPQAQIAATGVLAGAAMQGASGATFAGGALEAAAAGVVDRIVRPEETRQAVEEALVLLAHKRSLGRPPRRHAVLPL